MEIPIIPGGFPVTEQEWLTSNSPWHMMKWSNYYSIPSYRKFQLFAANCCWECDPDNLGRDAELYIKMDASIATQPKGWAMAWAGDQRQPSPEQRADMLRDLVGNLHIKPGFMVKGGKLYQMVSRKELPKRKGFSQLHEERWEEPGWMTPTIEQIARITERELRGPQCQKCGGKCERYAGEVAGLFHPWVKCDECNGRGHIIGVRLDSLNVAALADALEDVGCATAVLVEHLRNGKTHYRGCWVVDLLLGIE